MKEDEWRESIFRSWGIRVRYQNPRVQLLEACSIKGECWVCCKDTTKVGWKVIKAQRAAYGLFEAPLGRRDKVVATCGNKRCCWGGHLRLVRREAPKIRSKSKVSASSPEPTPDAQ